MTTMDDPIRLIESADLAAMRDLCKELLAEVRRLTRRVDALEREGAFKKALPPNIWPHPIRTLEIKQGLSDWRMWGQN